MQTGRTKWLVASGVCVGLGFEAKMGLDEGIRDLLAWLVDEEAVDMVDQATDQLVARGLTR